MKKLFLPLSIIASLSTQKLPAMDPFTLELYLAPGIDPQIIMHTKIYKEIPKILTFPSPESATFSVVTKNIREFLYLEPEDEIRLTCMYTLPKEIPHIGAWDSTISWRNINKTIALKFEASTHRPPATEDLWQEAIRYNKAISIYISSEKKPKPLPVLSTPVAKTEMRRKLLRRL